MESITLFVQHNDGRQDTLEVPTGISISLMEVLKGEGYPIEATCGGMALCATCRINILNIDEMTLTEPSEDELYIMDTLPDCNGNCRLSCQIHVNEGINGIRFSIPEEVHVF
jgi:2Fe-2S ferredoxin